MYRPSVWAGHYGAAPGKERRFTNYSSREAFAACRRGRSSIRRFTAATGGRPVPFAGVTACYHESGKPLLKIPSKFYPTFDDSSPPDAEVFRELLRVGKKVILWGGNFFGDNLPPASCWIVWDKKRRGMDQADCELAWTNLRGQSCIFEYRWNGMLQEDMKHKEERLHPTQKPVALFSYCYQLAGLKEGDTVLDCYMGSQSSRIAAYDMNLNYIGYEISKTYYELGEERFERHTAQYSLFTGGTE